MSINCGPWNIAIPGNNAEAQHFHCPVKHGVVLVPTLASLAVSDIAFMATTRAGSDDKVGTLTIYRFQETV